MLNCAKCGYDNELGRIFCHQCGSKLDLSEIKVPKIRKRAGKMIRPSKARLTRYAIELALVGVVIVCLFLAAKVPPVRPISTTNANVLSIDRKRFDLDQISHHNRPASIEVSEAEINAFVNTLRFDKRENSGLEISPIKVQLELGDGFLTIVCLGRLSIGGAWNKELYLRYTGVPAIENGKFEFKPLEGAFGALPLHRKVLSVTGVYDRYFGRLFGKLTREKQMLGKLSSISVNKNRILLNYNPSAPSR